MGVDVAVGDTGVFVGGAQVSVGDGVREGGIVIDGATEGATIGVPQATSKLSNTTAIKQAAKQGRKHALGLGSDDRILAPICLCPGMASNT